MKIVNKRNSLVFAASLLLASTPFASTFINETSDESGKLNYLTSVSSKPCNENNGWGDSENTLYCFALSQAINPRNLELD